MENLVINPITKEYGRYENNNNLKFKIGSLYNQNNIILTNSGLHSNFIAINTIVNKHDNINIIYFHKLYHETIELLNYFKNINLYKMNDNILDLFLSKLYNKNNILFIESCSNPNGDIFDFTLIKQIRELSLNLYVICDNTWLSSIIFNPFDHDVDIVTISLSKFYSGGNAICGSCLFKNNEDYQLANNYIKITGVHISPLHLNIINNQIDYLEKRINHCSELTYQVLEYLDKYPELSINHPSLKTHLSYNLKKYFKNNLIPSIFTIGFKITEDKLLDCIKKLKIIDFETSFGSKLSKIDTYIYNYNNLSFIRFSIGYDDNIDRIKDGINELLQYIHKLD
jgi:cystathionine beta-lyase/cystathionine gamma-synthase